MFSTFLVSRSAEDAWRMADCCSRRCNMIENDIYALYMEVQSVRLLALLSVAIVKNFFFRKVTIGRLKFS